jgi:nanoRNase/pAp phosphatase (c-di-AMP/oligoRNAs hydrolase)
MSDLKLPRGNPINNDRLDALRSVLGAGPVLILAHDSPDPDALASGKGLAALFERAWGIPCRLIYNGLIARAENRALLNLLTPEWEKMVSPISSGEFSAISLVDSQPMAGNNSLPTEILPQVVIDHHQPMREALGKVSYVDVRPEMGATVSMVFQYLEAAGISPDSDLATAMFYGLQTDTRGLARGASIEDEFIYVKLLSLLDRHKLIQVEQAGLSRDYYSAFSKGLHAARIFGKVVVADLGEMDRPDFTAEMADVFIRLVTAKAVLCLGRHEGTLYLSVRTKPLGLDAGYLVQKLVVNLGKAGGHGTMAGGQVPILGRPVQSFIDEIIKRFLNSMDESATGEMLLR